MRARLSLFLTLFPLFVLGHAGAQIGKSGPQPDGCAAFFSNYIASTGVPCGSGGGGIGINWRGAYSAGYSYAVNDAVSYNGSSYIAVQISSPGNSQLPTATAYWNLVAAQGSTGATGAAGPPPGISIGSVTTGAAGSQAAASISGSNPYQLNLTIPTGATGAAGSNGSGGSAGVSSFNGRSGAVAPAQGDYAASMISGLAASATEDTTDADNIDSGTIGLARLPTGIPNANLAHPCITINGSCIALGGTVTVGAADATKNAQEVDRLGSSGDSTCVLDTSAPYQRCLFSTGWKQAFNGASWLTMPLQVAAGSGLSLTTTASTNTVTLANTGITSLTTTGTSGAASVSSGVLNIPTPPAPAVTSLTTTGSGAATLSSGVLNIPTPSGGGSVTASSVQSALATQTGCTTSGYVYVPASNTCVAASGGGSSSPKFLYTNATIQAGDTVTSPTSGYYTATFASSTTPNIGANTLANGDRFFASALIKCTGTCAGEPDGAQVFIGYGGCATTIAHFNFGNNPPQYMEFEFNGIVHNIGTAATIDGIAFSRSSQNFTYASDATTIGTTFNTTAANPFVLCAESGHGTGDTLKLLSYVVQVN